MVMGLEEEEGGELNAKGERGRWSKIHRRRGGQKVNIHELAHRGS